MPDPSLLSASTARIVSSLSEQGTPDRALARDDFESLRLVLDASGDGVWSVDLPTGTVSVSPHWLAQFGYVPGEIELNLTALSALVHAEDLARSNALAQACAAVRAPRFEIEQRVRHKDGSYRVMHCQVHIVYDDRGQPVRLVGSNVEVTGQKHHEEALRARERFLRHVVEAVPVPIIVVRDGDEVLLANTAALSLLGVQEREYRGRRPDELGLPEHVVAFLRAENGLVEETECELFIAERSIRVGDGTTRWFQVRKVPITLPDEGPAVLGLLEEVTGRKYAEAELVRSEARLRRVIERMPVAIAVCRAGRWLYCNPALGAMLGYERVEELVGLPIEQIIHPDDRARILARAASVAATGQPTIPAEQRLLRRDGGTVLCEGMSLAVEYDGEPAVLAVLRDVTEQRRMELQLAQAGCLASVGTLAAGVAHEVNNPLTSVLGNLTLAIEQLDAALSAARAAGTPLDGRVEEARQLLDEARGGAERVRDIVRDLTTFARAEEEVRAPVDVRAVLDATARLAGNEIRHRARLVRDYVEVPAVLANQSRLAKALLNLIINAAQAIAPGDAEANEIRLTTRVDGAGRVVVEIRDTGEGIAPDVLPRVFDPFFTTRPVGEAIGLGLPISRSIVVAMGGTIEIESAVGRGSTVRVVLPVGPAEPRAECASVPPPPVAPRRARVLVVDDETAICRVLSRVLCRHEVVTVKSGREALQKLQSGEPVDIVLCDLMMPEVTGMAVFEQACALRPDLAPRFVFMTGGAFTPEAQAFLARVANPRIVKPFDPGEIRDLLGALLESRAS